MRSAFGIANGTLSVYCSTLVPLTTAVVIFNTAPFLVSLMGYYFNGEAIYKVEYIAMIICFACVLGITFSK